MSDLLSVSEVAKELGVSVRRVHQFISENRLPAEKIGTYYAIKRNDLELIRERKRTGRPKKERIKQEK